jgi:signal transduction histidine kinase
MHVDVDGEKLHTVLRNLLENAVKYSRRRPNRDVRRYRRQSCRAGRGC